ncbi:MAG: FAD-dependent oxidoreductase, partial [Betaproteobacteria bacterium]|nr:FAD-dependent oxidoreductase [Betaproteobacteria bacterium]
ALALRSSVARVLRHGSLFRVHGHAAGDDFTLDCHELVNAAGLQAVQLAHQIDALAPAHVPTLYRAKGQYLAYAGHAPFRHLIYPVPVDGGLGVHLTLDLAGQARFGPDVQWLDDAAPEDYTVDAQRAAQFAHDIRRYWPGLDAARLQPAYSGIRPKLAGAGMPAADFRIDGAEVHGLPGLVNLFGIESPGLTACLAIAGEVRTLLDRHR